MVFNKNSTFDQRNMNPGIQVIQKQNVQSNFFLPRDEPGTGLWYTNS